MAAAKKTLYITAELDFAEENLARWRQDIENEPYDKIEDRKEMQKTKTGGSFLAVVQTKEAIKKSQRDTLKEYIALLAEVNRLREVEEKKKVEVRGNGSMSGGAAKWLETRNE